MDVISRLGVRRIINARGFVTFASGSAMRPNALKAISDSSGQFVLLDELHQRAGIYVANLLGVPAAYISSGAAGGMLLVAAACLTGLDVNRIELLPRTRGFPNEILARRTERPNFVYQAMRASGAQVREVGRVAAVSLDRKSVV